MVIANSSPRMDKNHGPSDRISVHVLEQVLSTVALKCNLLDVKDMLLMSCYHITKRVFLRWCRVITIVGWSCLGEEQTA